MCSNVALHILLVVFAGDFKAGKHNVLGLNPPYGRHGFARKFVKHALEQAQPRILVLIIPKQDVPGVMPGYECVVSDDTLLVNGYALPPWVLFHRVLLLRWTRLEMLHGTCI